MSRYSRKRYLLKHVSAVPVLKTLHIPCGVASDKYGRVLLAALYPSATLSRTEIAKSEAPGPLCT